LIVFGGSLFTDYHLENAIINDSGSEFSLTQKNKSLEYSIKDKDPEIKNEGLKEMIGAIDRAYSVLGNKIRVTQIQRERWPIELVECTEFKTNFFETARLEGAFLVREMIKYIWLPPQTL
jgi:hypothetical protein